MKVICMSNTMEKVQEGCENTPHPQIGDECTVVMIAVMHGSPFYLLYEYPRNVFYAAKCFERTSDIDETTFVREFKRKRNDQ